MKPNGNVLFFPIHFIAITMLFIGGTSLWGCRKSPKIPASVWLEGIGKKSVKVEVEVAQRKEDRERGLMYRTHMASNAGMLFVYPVEHNYSFWMKNTYIPLDIIFISSNFRVVGMVENTIPLSMESYRVEAPSQFILEVNAGFVKKHGIQEGNRVRFEGIDKN